MRKCAKKILYLVVFVLSRSLMVLACGHVCYLVQPTMASNTHLDSPHSDFSDGQSLLNVVACLMFHKSTVARSSVAKGKKVAKTTTTKEMRVKDFQHVFLPSKPNYFVFLQTILDQHHLLQYKVSDQCNVYHRRCLT